MSQIFASIIIVNYCGKSLLANCLNSLSQISYKNFEIIVIDNKSEDDSIEFLHSNYPYVKIIELNKNYGFATPNNIAAKTAKGKYLVFLNNDTSVTCDWLSELIFTMESDKTIAIGQSLLKKPSGQIESSGDFIDKRGIAYSKTEDPQGVTNILSARAASMIVRRDTFLDLGGFDENYFASFEDVEISWKAWLWGYKVVIIPTSIAYHHGGQTVKKFSKIIAFHGTKNYISLLMTHFGLKNSFKIILKLLFFPLLKYRFKRKDSKTVSNFQIPDFSTILKASFWVLVNLNKIIKKRKNLQSRMVRTNDQLKEMGLIM